MPVPTPIGSPSATDVIAGGGYDQLQTSGDTSSTVFQKWFVHSQVLEGMWIRRWVYKDSPTLGGGVASACPSVDYTYLDVNITEGVVQEFETASYASGFTQLQDIDYWSGDQAGNNASGGWGVSGQFWTNKVGIIRSGATTTDKESRCNTSWNIQAAKMPGDYTPSLDTSSNFNGQFMSDIVMNAGIWCENFKTGLVQI